MENAGTKTSDRVITQRRAHLPKSPFQNMAISLSGGGFRATSNHLGVLSYLSLKKYQKVSLLQRLRIISTVSAGTFAGVKYITTLKKGGTFEDCYKSLYSFMVDKNLVGDALEYLSQDSNWTKDRKRSLINAFASIYHREFESETFGILWQEEPAIHLKEITFNATEFSFALPFHFRKAENPHAKLGSLAHEFIGNKKIHIPIEVAKEIRLADIIAASSCFPFGFEPINFPDDFIYDGAVKLKDKSLFPKMVFDGDKIDYPIGLMDGGIDDNQGVDAILAAEQRMKNYTDHLKEFRSNDKKSIDLYILSDGTNPTMEGYLPNNADKLKFFGKWNFNSLRSFGITSVIIGGLSILYACLSDNKSLVILSSMFGTFGLVMAFVLLIFSMGFVGLTKRIGVPEFFVQRLFHVDKLRFKDLNNLLVNRRKSVSKMITKVFIKHMRWFSHERVYGDPVWRPRLIMNAVFELTEIEVAKRKRKYPYFSSELIEPGPEIMLVAAKALTMGTTLWFTPEELAGDKNMINTVIACGQFTICFNLLEYFEKYINNKTYQSDYDKYSDEIKEELNMLQQSLLDDWRKFKIDPYWMVNEWNAKLIG